MKKKRERDPELESLLRAFREVNPTTVESDRWRTAIAEELRDLSLPLKAREPKIRTVPVVGRVYRFLLRAAAPVAVAASLGFVIGAYFVENRINSGQSMFFSQTEPVAMKDRPPATMDDEREVVHFNLDSGVVR